MKKGVRILLIVLMLLISGAAYLYLSMYRNWKTVSIIWNTGTIMGSTAFWNRVEQLPIWMWQSLSVRLCSKDFYIPVF